MTPSRTQEVMAAGLALAAAAGSLVVAMLALQVPLGPGLATLAGGTLGSADALAATFGRGAALILTTLAVALAWQVRLANVGGEGQMLAGALTALAIGQFVPAPPFVAGALMLGMAMLAGAIMMLPMLRLPRGRGSDAALTGLVLNVLMLVLAQALLAGPLQGAAYAPAVLGRALSPLLPVSLLVALALATITALVLRFTVWGFRLKVLAANAAAARFAGIDAGRTVGGIGLMSGLIGGAAGFVALLHQSGSAAPLLTGGLGYAGIAAAIIGGRSPLGWIASAMVMAVLIGACAAGTRAGWWPESMALLPAAAAMVVTGARIVLRRRGRRATT